MIGLYEINVPTTASTMQANNIYSYCVNSPIVRLDPGGESWVIVTLAAVVVVALTSCESQSTDDFIKESRLAGNDISRGVPDFPGWDSSAAPGSGWEWRGPSDLGSWYNPSTGSSLRPDFNHEGDIKPHWDYKDPDGNWYRIYEDGTYERK